MDRTIDAIETFYGGTLFRSRLEARWAVFFDAAGIDWQYEPRFIRSANTENDGYLPDFHLPNLIEPDGGIGVYVEVKPTDDLFDRERYGRLIDRNGTLPNLLLLGEIPDASGVACCHSFCSWDSGVICRQVWFTSDSLIHEPRAYPGDSSPAKDTLPDEASCIPSWLMIHTGRHAEQDAIGKINNRCCYSAPKTIADAYFAARTYRFAEAIAG